MNHIAIDLSAPVALTITVRGASGGYVYITVSDQLGVVNITSAVIKYYAALSTPVSKTVGAGITITDPANGEFRIEFVAADTSSQNTNQNAQHECKLTVM